MNFYNYDDIKKTGDCLKFAKTVLNMNPVNSNDMFHIPWRAGSDSGALSINERGWTDFVTNKKGSIIDLCAKVFFGGDIIQAQEFLGQHYNLKPVNIKRKTAPTHTAQPKPIVTEKNNKAAKQYVIERGIKPKDIEPVIAYEYSLKHKKYKLCITFEHENIIQFIFLDGEKLFKKGHGPNKNVWKHKSFTPDKPIYITESIIDALSLIHWGYNAVCSFSGVNIPNKFYETLPKDSKIVLSLDNDITGNNGVKKNYKYLTSNGYTNVSVAIPIFDQKDWNDILVKTQYNLSDQLEMSKCLMCGDTFIKEVLSTEAWGNIDLNEDFKEIPPFPINSVPAIVRDMTIEIQKTVKVQPEVAAQAVMTTLSACFGNKVYTDVSGEVKTRTNMYSIIFLARGERKSAIYSKTIQPIYRWIDTQILEYKRAKKQQRFKFRKIESLEGQLLKAKGNTFELEHNIENLERESSNEQIINPFFLAENTTNEACIDILKTTGGIVGLFADDARDLIQVMMGIYTDGFSKEHLYTKIYDGFNPLTNNRKKDDVIIYYPCAIVFLMTQIDVIDLISKVDSFFAGGFISRIEFCYPNSLVGKRYPDGNLVRSFDKRRMSPEITDRYENLIFSLLDRYYYNQEEINIPVTPEAENIWIEFYHEVEGDSHDDGVFGGDKLDFAIRIAQKVLKYALNFALIEGKSQIQPEHMEWGIDIALYYYQHAEKVFDAISKRCLSRDSKKILSQLGNEKLVSNAIFNSTKGMQFSNLKKESFEIAVKELIDKNYIREIEIEQTTGRKAPARKFEVNPQYIELHGAGAI